jgi:hypothetical protein
VYYSRSATSFLPPAAGISRRAARLWYPPGNHGEAVRRKLNQNALQSLEHIRLRKWHVHRTSPAAAAHFDDDGIYILRQGSHRQLHRRVHHGPRRPDRCDRTRTTTVTITVRDYGRGIPARQTQGLRFSQINTGAKYNDDVFQFSVGLNGVGTKAVNALSDLLPRPLAFRDGKYAEAEFELRQVLSARGGRASTDEAPGRNLRGQFRADPRACLENFALQCRPPRRPAPVRFYAYLNAGLKILMFNKRKNPLRGRTARPAPRRRSSTRRSMTPWRTLADNSVSRSPSPTRTELREDVLVLRQRAVHLRRRHPPLAPSAKGILQAASTSFANKNFAGRRRPRRRRSVRSRSGMKDPQSSRARPRTSSATPMFRSDLVATKFVSQVVTDSLHREAQGRREEARFTRSTQNAEAAQGTQRRSQGELARERSKSGGA